MYDQNETQRQQERRVYPFEFLRRHKWDLLLLLLILFVVSYLLYNYTSLFDRADAAQCDLIELSTASAPIFSENVLETYFESCKHGCNNDLLKYSIFSK